MTTPFNINQFLMQLLEDTERIENIDLKILSSHSLSYNDNLIFDYQICNNLLYIKDNTNASTSNILYILKKENRKFVKVKNFIIPNELNILDNITNTDYIILKDYTFGTLSYLLPLLDKKIKFNKCTFFVEDNSFKLFILMGITY